MGEKALPSNAFELFDPSLNETDFRSFFFFRLFGAGEAEGKALRFCTADVGFCGTDAEGCKFNVGGRKPLPPKGGSPSPEALEVVKFVRLLDC